MALRNIVKKGDDVLTKMCRPVEKFDEKLCTLLDDMYETMEAANGVGLAAPQVCCFMVARLLDEEISMYGYEGKENWEREQLPDKLSRSSTDERHGDK